MGLFDRPAPQQSVPEDLGGLRGSILQALLGGAGHGGGLIGQIRGMGETNPGLQVLGPLSTQFHQNLTDALSQINANSPRFSSGAAYLGGQTAGRALNDYNLLSAQVLQQGQDQQLRAIMSLLGPASGPTFGGPFTQGSSPWENILGGVSAVGSLVNPFGGQRPSGGGGWGSVPASTPYDATAPWGSHG